MSTMITIYRALSKLIVYRSEGPEVPGLKAMLNVVLKWQPALDTASNRIDEAALAAVMEFQRREKLKVDGRVGNVTYHRLLRVYRYHYALLTGGSTPSWMRVAQGEMGQREVVGKGANPQIVSYLNTCPYLKRKGASQSDETAWCAAFVNWCLKRSGFPGLDTDQAGLARTWSTYGVALDGPRVGAIAVIYRAAASSDTATGNHVGFLVDGGVGNRVTLLGGNQGDQVVIRDYVGWDLIGLRWPTGGAAG
ncbi:MAG: TIGR02594 family protein [Rubrivivax sp.]